MTKDAIAFLAKDGRRFELHFPEYDLTVRGPYAEWVLEAAAEIVGRLERTKAETTIEEMEMLKDFGADATTEIEIESGRYELTRRFETIPQCIVTMNDMDYRWVSRDGRPGGDANGFVQRLHDLSLTRNGTFLTNQQ